MNLSVSVLGADPVALQLRPTLSATDAIRECVAHENKAGANIDPDLAQYELYAPARGCFLAKTAPDGSSSKKKGGGPAEAPPLNTVCGSGDFLKVVHQRDVADVRVLILPHSSNWSALPSAADLQKKAKTLRTDFTDPLSRTVGTISRLLKTKDKEEYPIRVLRTAGGDAGGGEPGAAAGDGDRHRWGGFLNANLSLNEQDVPHGTTLVLVPLSVLSTRALSTFKAPQMEGWMVKTSKKADRKTTGKKKRWCVLDGNLLAYYPDNKPASKPKGIVDLEFMQVTLEEGKKDGKLQLEKSTISWTKKPLCYMFKPEKRDELPAWSRLITKRCVNGAPFQMFGVSLQCLKERERDREIPMLLEETMAFVEKTGIDGEGVFRVPGNAGQIDLWRDMCDRGQQDEVVEQFSSSGDSDSVAGLLKLFLRELPEPILSFERYDRFVAAKDNMEKISKEIASLPLPNQVLLEKLLNFIALVESHKKKNKMDFDALVTVFAPNLLRPKIETADSLMRDSVKVNAVILALITKRAQIKFQRPVALRQASTRGGFGAAAQTAVGKVGAAGKNAKGGMNLPASLIGPLAEKIEGGRSSGLAPPPPLLTPAGAGGFSLGGISFGKPGDSDGEVTVRPPPPETPPDSPRNKPEVVLPPPVADEDSEAALPPPVADEDSEAAQLAAREAEVEAKAAALRARIAAKKSKSPKTSMDGKADEAEVTLPPPVADLPPDNKEDGDAALAAREAEVEAKAAALRARIAAKKSKAAARAKEAEAALPPPPGDS